MEDQERKPYLGRLVGMSIVVALVFALLGFNLWNLQIAKASYYTSKAEGNVMQLVSTPATRGDIIDRKGNLLVTSVPQFALTIDWMDLQKAQNADWKEVIRQLAGYIQPYWQIEGQSVDLITEDILVLIQNHQWERYRPVTVMIPAPEKSEALRAVIAEHQEELPGVSVEALPVRDYRRQTLAGHILGYVREISTEEEIERFNQNPQAQQDGFTYARGDLVGKSGVEKSYDYWLRGTEGVQQVVVDNNARPISKNVVKPAEPGKTLQLTLDGELQEVVEQTLDQVFEDVVHPAHPESNAGAAVVIEVKTGKILAMTSRPFMNPNDLTGIISDEIANKYFKGADQASLDRALSGAYAPGSTFKMITGMSALQGGVVTPTERFDSSDRVGTLGKNGIEEWKAGGFGLVNLNRAMANSSNIYFQAVGQRVFAKNPELIKQVANEFGLGVYTGVDLPGETEGRAPSPEWKKAFGGPTWENWREKKLADLESKYEPLLSEASDSKAKDKLLQQKNGEQAEIERQYNYYVYNYVDWQYIDTFNTSIGQGDNLYTPLQLANYVATIVNGGKRMQPYVVDKILDPTTGDIVYENQPVVKNTVSISPENIALIKEAMRHVTIGEGTASWLFADVPQFTGGAKTGTAQTGSKGTDKENIFNGVFVAFAPYDDPQIAFAGIVESGGHGGETAGLVAKAAFMKYFGWDNPK